MNEGDLARKALEISDPQEQANFIESACADNAQMKERVLQLVRTQQSSQAVPPKDSEEFLVAFDETVRLGASVDRPDPSISDGDPVVESEFRKYLSSSKRQGWLGRLGHYEIEEILGHGAFGIVAKAFDEKLHRVVAIKMLRPEFATTSPPRKRFLREARSAAAVLHENIVAIHAVEEEPLPFLVTEYVAGHTLQRRLDGNGPLDIAEVLKISAQVASGLAAAHKVGLIHRDIKPANILLTTEPNERAKISDFGLARAVDDASLTSSGVIAGTPLYMAPEQARAESLDHRADLFSLGSVMYQMVSGRPAFRGPTTMAVLKRVCDDTPRPIEDVIPGTPAWLCEIVFRLLEKQPSDRFQTADELVSVLKTCQEKLLVGELGVTELTPGRTSIPRRDALRAPWSLPKTTAVVVACGLLALIPVLYRQFSPQVDRADELVSSLDLASGNEASGNVTNHIEVPPDDQVNVGKFIPVEQSWKVGMTLAGGSSRVVANTLPESYRLDFLMQADDSLLFTTVFPVGDSQACLTFGGWRDYGPPLNGLELVGGRPLLDQFKKLPGDFFEDNQSHRVTLMVTPNSVCATLDGMKVAGWVGDSQGLSRFDWLGPHPDGTIFIQALHGNWHVSELTIQEWRNSAPQRVTDSEIVGLIEEVGGRITIGESPVGPSLNNAPPSLSSNLVHIDFRRTRTNAYTVFRDEQLKRLARMLESRPDIRVGCVNLVGTNISNNGLLALRHVPMKELLLFRTKAECDEIAEELAEFPVQDWDFGHTLTSKGLTQLAKSRSLLGISLDSNVIDNESLAAFVDSRLKRLQIYGRPNRPLPTIDQIKAIGSLEALYLPAFDVPEPLLAKLQASLPGVSLKSNSYSDRLSGPGNSLGTDQEILSLVEAVGGTIRQYAEEGEIALKSADNPSLSAGGINILIAHSPNFDDAALTRLARLLKQRPDISIVCFHVTGTSITNSGLLSLKGMKIAQLYCDRTNINGDELAPEAAEFQIGEWSLVPGLTELGWGQFLKSSALSTVWVRGSDTNENVLKELDGSTVRRLIMVCRNASELPNSSSFHHLTQPSLLTFVVDGDVPATYLEDIHNQAPWLSIESGTTMIKPDRKAAKVPLARGKTLNTFASTAIEYDVPAAYRLEFEATRVGGTDCIAVRFPVAQSAALALFSGWPQNGSLTGLALVDGVDVPASPQKLKGDFFADGKPHRIVLEVTPSSVKGFVDGAEVIDWEGDPSSLAVYDYLSGEEIPMFFRTYADFYVSGLKLESIGSTTSSSEPLE